MKQILLVIYTATYTSLIWANVAFGWIPIGAPHERFYLGAFLFIISTLVNIFAVGCYIYNHWND